MMVLGRHHRHAAGVHLRAAHDHLPGRGGAHRPRARGARARSGAHAAAYAAALDGLRHEPHHARPAPPGWRHPPRPQAAGPGDPGSPRSARPRAGNGTRRTQLEEITREEDVPDDVHWCWRPASWPRRSPRRRRRPRRHHGRGAVVDHHRRLRAGHRGGVRRARPGQGGQRGRRRHRPQPRRGRRHPRRADPGPRADRVAGDLRRCSSRSSCSSSDPFGGEAADWRSRPAGRPSPTVWHAHAAQSLFHFEARFAALRARRPGFFRLRASAARHAAQWSASRHHESVDAHT